MLKYHIQLFQYSALYFNPFAPVIVFFVDFCVCPTIIVPYPANAS